MPDSPSPNDIRARLRELGYLKNPLDRFVFGGGSTGGALKLALGAGLRGALITGPLLAGFGIILLGDELAPDEKLSWFLAFTMLFGLLVFFWVIAQALLIHFVAARRNRSLESLPVFILIAAGTGLLMPALLWLLASGRIHSATLGAGFGGGLLTAVALLAAASFTIFSASRAAAILAAKNLDSIAQTRSGMLSALLGIALLALISGVFLQTNHFVKPTNSTQTVIKRDLKKYSGYPLHVIAVDGILTGELAPALGANAVKLLEFPADPDLIAGWMKLQSGQREWRAQSMTGYRALWGGRNHSPDAAPGRLLKLLQPMQLSRVAPLPGSYERPQFFWELIQYPAYARVVGGWHTYPLTDRNTELVSDRAFLSLEAGHSATGTTRIREEKLKFTLDALHSKLKPGPAGLRLDEFHRAFFYPAYKWERRLEPELIWLYLPGADIVCGKSETHCMQANQNNRDFLQSMQKWSSILLIENPGRQGGTGAIWFRPAKDEKIRPVHAPEELAAAVLDYLDYPLSAELAGVKPEEAKLATYGRIVVEDSGESDDATLKALKSLGYLQ